jgi:U3 small nucleolar RNA-associated protein 25
MPETRALFNNTFKNAAGKVRIEKVWPAIQVPESIDQVGAFFLLTRELRIHHAKTFIPFDSANPKDEPDKRFAYFTTQVISVALALTSSLTCDLTLCKLLPRVLKSAVQSANTVIFIPSSFDFIRVHNYFRKQSSVSFVVLSE